MSRVRISIIIPAYNEERYLPACLDAIAAQTKRPFEVLVVDNNSSDQTAAVAKRYPFVTVLQEAQQGGVYARNRGLNSAKGELLARIDADTVIPNDWVEKVERVATRFPNDGAFTGPGLYYDVPLPRLFSFGQVLFYQWLQWPAMRGATLYGATMAMRRDSWIKVRDGCHTIAKFDEDVDLTLQLRKHGIKTRYTTALAAAMSLHRDNTDPVSVTRYVSTWPRNYRVNGFPLAAAYITVLTAILIVIAAVSWVVFAPIIKLGQLVAK